MGSVDEPLARTLQGRRARKRRVRVMTMAEYKADLKVAYDRIRALEADLAAARTHLFSAHHCHCGVVSIQPPGGRESGVHAAIVDSRISELKIRKMPGTGK